MAFRAQSSITEVVGSVDSLSSALGGVSGSVSAGSVVT